MTILTKFSLEKSQDSTYSKTILEIFCFIKDMEDKSEKFRTYLLSSVSLKGFEEHDLCLPNVSESISNGRMLVLDTSGCRFESCLSECYGVYNVLVFEHAGLWHLKGGFKSLYTHHHPLPEKLLGESAKLFFMGANPIGMSKIGD